MTASHLDGPMLAAFASRWSAAARAASTRRKHCFVQARRSPSTCLSGFQCPTGSSGSGVAPDHPKLKLVTAAFDRIATTPGFRFIGGVAVGRDVTIGELRECYDAVGS